MTHIFGYFRVSSDQNPGRPEPDKRLDKVQYGDSLADFLRLVEELTHRGVTLQFMKEGLRFEDGENVSSTSKLMLTIVSAFNEFERIIVIERQREGIELAKVSRIIGISRTSACRYLECGKSKE